MPVTSSQPIPLSELQRRVRSIEDSALDLAAALEHAAAQIDAEGDLPEQSVAQRLDSLLSEAASLARLLADQCDEPAPPGPSTNEFHAALDRIGEIRRQREQRQRKAERVRAILQSAVSLQHVDDDSFAPLQTSRSLAAECLAHMDAMNVDSLPEEADALIDGTHPLAALLVLVQGGSDLDDTRWAELQDLVTTKFGRTLATAVARGRIQIGLPLPPADAAEPGGGSE